jgi:hypothetical protein
MFGGGGIFVLNPDTAISILYTAVNYVLFNINELNFKVLTVPNMLNHSVPVQYGGCTWWPAVFHQVQDIVFLCLWQFCGRDLNRVLTGSKFSLVFWFWRLPFGGAHWVSVPYLAPWSHGFAFCFWFSPTTPARYLSLLTYCCVGTDCCVYWELQVRPLLLFVFRYVFPSVYSKLLYYVLIKGCVCVTASTVASTYDFR